MQNKPAILVVEDESAIADAISYALKTEGFKADCFETGAQALIALTKLAYSLVIIDIGLPDISGFEVCRKIRQTSDLPIIFLTARSEEVDKILGLELGGDDYITKPFSPRELVARVKVILRRVANKENADLDSGQATNFKLDHDKCKVYFKNQALELSRYEFRLLTVLLKRPGRVFSREELMNRAWESPEMSLERTVDAHIKSIRAKLRLIDPKDDSIETHRGFGYALKEGA